MPLTDEQEEELKDIEPTTFASRKRYKKEDYSDEWYFRPTGVGAEGVGEDKTGGKSGQQ